MPAMSVSENSTVRVMTNSLGIGRKSLVYDALQLMRRFAAIREELGDAAIAEEYIEGREFYVGVLGNSPPRALPPCAFRELHVSSKNRARMRDYRWTLICAVKRISQHGEDRSGQRNDTAPCNAIGVFRANTRMIVKFRISSCSAFRGSRARPSDRRRP